MYSKLNMEVMISQYNKANNKFDARIDANILSAVIVGLLYRRTVSQFEPFH